VCTGARRVEKLEAVKKEIESFGGTALIQKTDVTKREEVKALVAEAEKQFGEVHILVNNAGVMPLTMFRSLHEDEWEQMIDVNIKGVLNGIGAVLPSFLKRGSGDIVNISSDAGRKLFEGGGVYCATKWAVEAITQGRLLN